MIVKVKEPQAPEVAMLREGQTLFTYLHLAPDPELTRGLVDSGATCIAYETVEDRNGRLPLLAPMSEIAGKIATQAGAFMLEKPLGGRGLLLGGVPGVAAGKVMVIGGGVVGQNAAEVAIGMGAETYVYDRNIDRLRDLEFILNGRCSTCFASHARGRGAPARDGPRHRRRARARRQGPARDHPRAARPDEEERRARRRLDRPGRLLRDQPGRPPTPTPPTRSTASRTTAWPTCPAPCRSRRTWALTNATMPFVVRLADRGPAALADDPGFMAGLNVAAGRVTYEPVARDQGLEHTPPQEALALVDA